MGSNALSGVIMSWVDLLACFAIHARATFSLPHECRYCDRTAGTTAVDRTLEREKVAELATEYIAILQGTVIIRSEVA
jgi:hypothetical protein